MCAPKRKAPRRGRVVAVFFRRANTAKWNVAYLIQISIDKALIEDRKCGIATNPLIWLPIGGEMLINNKAMTQVWRLRNSRTQGRLWISFPQSLFYRLFPFQVMLQRCRCIFSEFLVALLLGFGFRSWNWSPKRVLFGVNPLMRWIS